MLRNTACVMISVLLYNTLIADDELTIINNNDQTIKVLVMYSWSSYVESNFGGYSVTKVQGYRELRPGDKFVIKEKEGLGFNFAAIAILKNNQPYANPDFTITKDNLSDDRKRVNVNFNNHIFTLNGSDKGCANAALINEVQQEIKFNFKHVKDLTDGKKKYSIGIK